ncbi:hypothetical protein V8C26DRAFT_91057 [Trichoderma gracile]
MRGRDALRVGGVCFPALRLADCLSSTRPDSLNLRSAICHLPATNSLLFSTLSVNFVNTLDSRLSTFEYRHSTLVLPRYLDFRASSFYCSLFPSFSPIYLTCICSVSSFSPSSHSLFFFSFFFFFSISFCPAVSHQSYRILDSSICFFSSSSSSLGSSPGPLPSLFLG